MPDQAVPILVPSSLANLQTILDDLLAAPSAFMLASSWSFNRFDRERVALAEFDLPSGWSLVAERVAAFAGVELLAFESDPADRAYERLELRQPVVLAVDSHELPYRPAYRKVHSARTIVATRIDRTAGTVDVIDPWLPAYAGPLPIAALDAARQSEVPEDHLLEPLYAGTALKRRWWTLALSAAAPTGTLNGALAAVSALAHEATRTGSADGLEQFRAAAMEALASGSRGNRVRRAVALHLRGEIGLRAHVLALLRRTAHLMGDSLLAAETERWGLHLGALGIARDVLIKSIGFDRPEYTPIVDRALREAHRREQRFVDFVSEFCAIEDSKETSCRITLSG
jgi:hypothetical protein